MDRAPATPLSPAGRAWRHVRAAFVAFHVCAVTLAALPATNSALKRSAWKDPTVKAELSVWAARFGMEEEAFTDRAWDLAVGWYKVRTNVLRPFDPYLKLGQLDQSWQMFVAPHVWPTRLRIEERRAGGGWEPLYEEGSDTATWQASALRVERLRASIFRWGWVAYADAYHRGCEALGRRRYAEDPTVEAVRCRFAKAKTPSVEEYRRGEEMPVRWVFVYEVKR